MSHRIPRTYKQTQNNTVVQGFVFLWYFKKILPSVDGLWCALQDKVNTMVRGAAWGLRRHPKGPTRWSPSWILLKIRNYKKTVEIELFYARHVEYDYSLMVLPTSYVVTRGIDSYQTLPKRVKMISVQLLKTTGTTIKSPLAEVEEKPYGRTGIHDPPPPLLVRPRVKPKDTFSFSSSSWLPKVSNHHTHHIGLFYVSKWFNVDIGLNGRWNTLFFEIQDKTIEMSQSSRTTEWYNDTEW